MCLHRLCTSSKLTQAELEYYSCFYWVYLILLGQFIPVSRQSKALYRLHESPLLSIPFSHLAQFSVLDIWFAKGWSLGGLRSRRYRAASLQLLAQRKTRIVQEDELVRGLDSFRGLHYFSGQSLITFLSAYSLLLPNKEGSLITDCSPLFESLLRRQWSHSPFWTWCLD